MDTLRTAVQLTKALAHPTRLRILALLRHGALPVCQITSVLHSVASTVSGHLNDLRHSGLVTEHRQGKFVYYSVTETPAAAAVLDGIFRPLADDPQLREDAALGESIRTVSPLTVCDGLPLGPDGRVGPARASRPGGARS